MLRRAAYGVLAYNLAVILWGAFVRATGSGAGCGSHWPTCTGEVVPRAASVETAIDLIPHTAKKRQIDTVLSNSFGFGGTNASLVMRRVA